MSFDEKFAALRAKLDKDPEAKLAFQENPLTTLKAADIPLIETMTREPEAITLAAFARENMLPATVKENILATLTPVNLSSEPIVMAMEASGSNEQPVVAMAMETSSSDGEQIIVNSHWWGYDIVMNQKLTEDIIEGLTTTEALTGIISAALVAAGVVTGGIAVIVGGAIAGTALLKAFEIKIANNGKGVHWPVTWPQQVYISQSGDPIGSVILFLHPFRN
jgi:hypothetical protein